MVSDNAPPFHSEVFEEFLRGNGIQQKFRAPFHPATNGAAERAVQVLKQGLRKQTEGSLQTKLSRVLMASRCTPHTSTGFAPSELLFKRRLRTRLDLLHPEKLSEGQAQKEPKRKFEEGDGVFVRDYRNAKRSWIPGTILKCLGRAHYKVKVLNGVWKRHLNQLLRRPNQVAGTGESESDTLFIPEEEESKSAERGKPAFKATVSSPGARITSQRAERRYPSRARKPVSRYGL